VVKEWEQWNYQPTAVLARSKIGIISEEADFLSTVMDSFTDYFQPLVRCINRLRRVVFPDGKRRKSPDETLYSQMAEILLDAMNDPQVA
jgi:hypothetical protein